MSDTPKTDAAEELLYSLSWDTDVDGYDREQLDPVSAVRSEKVRELERENAALREALADADELERYSGSDGERQWGRCSTWLHPDDAVVIISAKAFDAARKEAQP